MIKHKRKQTLLLNIMQNGIGQMAPWAKCLLCKHWKLSSNPQHPWHSQAGIVADIETLSPE